MIKWSANGLFSSDVHYWSVLFLAVDLPFSAFGGLCCLFCHATPPSSLPPSPHPLPLFLTPLLSPSLFLAYPVSPFVLLLRTILFLILLLMSLLWCMWCPCYRCAVDISLCSCKPVTVSCLTYMHQQLTRMLLLQSHYFLEMCKGRQRYTGNGCSSHSSFCLTWKQCWPATLSYRQQRFQPYIACVYGYG